MTTKETSDEADSTDTGTDADQALDENKVEGDSTSRDIVSYLEWGAMAGLGLIALIAVFQFYFSASRAIGIWISPDFEPVFQAAFNIVVLLFAATGIVVFARRRRGSV